MVFAVAMLGSLSRMFEVRWKARRGPALVGRSRGGDLGGGVAGLGSPRAAPVQGRKIFS